MVVTKPMPSNASPSHDRHEIMECCKRFRRRRYLVFIFLAVAFTSFCVSGTMFHSECLDIMPNCRVAVPRILSVTMIPARRSAPFTAVLRRPLRRQLIHRVEQYLNGKVIHDAFGEQLETIVHNIADQDNQNTNDDSRSHIDLFSFCSLKNTLA
ncbi:MAG: hypothetical protein PHQ75_03095 [Thermoguttaceae bacterium]|nr:hypothetical protein [Thermoguttaceae bacterium]